MWQKPLLLGDKNRNITAVYRKRVSVTSASAVNSRRIIVLSYNRRISLFIYLFLDLCVPVVGVLSSDPAIIDFIYFFSLARRASRTFVGF